MNLISALLFAHHPPFSLDSLKLWVFQRGGCYHARAHGEGCETWVQMSFGDLRKRKICTRCLLARKVFVASGALRPQAPTPVSHLAHERRYYRKVTRPLPNSPMLLYSQLTEMLSLSKDFEMAHLEGSGQAFGASLHRSRLEVLGWIQEYDLLVSTRAQEAHKRFEDSAQRALFAASFGSNRPSLVHDMFTSADARETYPPGQVVAFQNTPWKDLALEAIFKVDGSDFMLLPSIVASNLSPILFDMFPLTSRDAPLLEVASALFMPNQTGPYSGIEGAFNAARLLELEQPSAL